MITIRPRGYKAAFAQLAHAFTRGTSSVMNLSIIPENKREAVKSALQNAFDTDQVETIELITGGMSPALVFKLTVNGAPYVLRLIVNTDDVNNPGRQFACMKTAAEIGVAPRVLYANVEDGVSITDFIEPQPITQATSFEGGFLAEVARILRKVHAAPLFPEF